MMVRQRSSTAAAGGRSRSPRMRRAAAKARPGASTRHEKTFVTAEVYVHPHL